MKAGLVTVSDVAALVYTTSTRHGLTVVDHHRDVRLPSPECQRVNRLVVGATPFSGEGDPWVDMVASGCVALGATLGMVEHHAFVIPDADLLGAGHLEKESYRSEDGGELSNKGETYLFASDPVS